MRVVMMTWEYPPRIVGGIARHVEELAWGLARAGHEIDVVTCAFADAPADERYRDVSVHRVHPYSPANDFVHWVQQLNAAMYDRACDLVEGWLREVPDKKRLGGDEAILIHAHDWVAHYTSARLKHAFHLPLAATIHATEYGRNQGIHTGQQQYISSVERDLATEAWRVIVCSDYMRGEVERALGTPWDKTDVIPNAIHAEKFDFPFPEKEAAAFRATYAAADERLVLFSGRMVREKGAHILLEAVRIARDGGLPIKLVIVGGGDRQHLEHQAEALQIAPHVYFAGFVPDDTLLRLYRVADAACFPSLYEPFGIVALEAMAAGAPVIVSDAGGLTEFVEPDRTGTVVWSGSVESLLWGLRRALTETVHAREMAKTAQEVVRDRFNWDRVASLTAEVYSRIWGEFVTSPW